MEKLNLFVTGATGFIGRELVNKLIKDGNSRLFLLIRRIEDREKFPNISNVGYLISDVLNVSEVEKQLAKIKIDCVVHLAAILDSKNKDIYKVNVEGTRNIVKLAKLKGVKKLIYLSSITVKRRFELDYSMSKAISEEYIVNSGLPYVILRPSWVVGKSSRSFKNFIQSLEKLPFVPVIGDGDKYTQPVYLDDLVSLINQVIFLPVSKRVLEVGGGAKITYNDLIDLTLRKLKIEKLKIHVPTFLCEILARFTNLLSLDVISDFSENTVIDVSALKKEFQYNPRSYEQILELVLQGDV